MKLDIFEFSIYDDLRKRDCNFSFGLLVSDEKIDLFLTDQDSVYDLEQQIPSICQGILAEYHPDKNLQDIKWTYTAGGGHSDLIFDQCNGLATTMTISNDAVLEPYCCAYEIETYEAALNDPRGLETALLDGYPEEALSSFSRDPIVRYLAYTPNHDTQKIHVLKAAYERFLEDNPVVFVDSQKFISYWKQQCTPKEPEEGLISKLKEKFFDMVEQKKGYCDIDSDDNVLLSSTLEKSLKHRIPNDMACGVSLDHNNNIRFTNGRHRTVNLANLGAPFIPVQTYKGGEKQLVDMFEWDGSTQLDNDHELSQ